MIITGIVGLRKNALRVSGKDIGVNGIFDI